MPAFNANKHMISNGEFMEFVKDAGYARSELWSESGWGWKMFRNVKCPKFWVPEVHAAGWAPLNVRVFYSRLGMKNLYC